MKKLLWCFALLLCFAPALRAAENPAKDASIVTLYAGTLGSPTNDPAIPPSEGIYRLEFNTQSGKLVNCGLAAKAKGPSWVAKHPTLEGVYYTAAGNEDGTSKESLIIAFKKQPDGSLSRINTCSSGGTCACHLSVHPSGKFLCVANYCSGQVAFIELNSDGSLGKTNAVFTLEGSGPNAARQQQSYAHFVAADRAGKFSLCCNLGGDTIHSFVFDEAENVWKTNPNFPVTHSASGSGPRHLAFSPNGKYVYVLNELSCTLDAFSYDSETGSLTLAASSQTLPTGYAGLNKAAAIDISADGKHVYVTNRGANLITVFAVDDTPIDGAKMEAGAVLNAVQYFPSGGEFPRFASLDSTGRYFFSCNKKSHNVLVYGVDPETGKLKDIGSKIQIAWCTCIVD